MENKDNILSKFVNFVKRLLGHDVPKLISAPEEEGVKQDSKSNFIDEIRINKKEDPELLKLQNHYENGKITLSEMSDEQLYELDLLYKRQVSELKKKLDDKKTELSIMQHKLKSYSSNAN